MPRSAADVVDSKLQDFAISDDGYDRGPVTTWPAPQLGDDRSNAYRIKTGFFERPKQSGLFDVYAHLRHEPDAPMVHSYPPAYVIVADAQGFVSMAEAGMIHEIAGLMQQTGFADAGAFAFADAGDILSEIRRWHGVMLDIVKQRGVNLDAAANNAITAAFQAMSNAANTKTASQSVANAHAVTLREVRRILKREPSKDLADNILAHARNMDKLIPGGGGFFKALGSAVTSVGSSIVSAAKDVAKVAAPLVNVVKVIAPFAQTALSFVPGVGTVVNGAIAAGSALAQGKNITQALIDTAAAAIPGGALAKQAFSTGLNIVKGQNITTAALDAVRNQIPGGLAAKAAFDTAVALAHGQSVQQAALGVAKQAVQGAVSSVAGQARSQGMSILDQLSPVATRALSSVGPQIIGSAASRAIPSLLPASVRNVAQAVLNRPELRSLPIPEVARRMNVTEHDARAGVASVVQAVSRAGGNAVPKLAPAQAIANQLGSQTTFDRAIAAFASRARPPVFSHNALRQLGARGFIDAGGIGFADAGALPPTIQQGSTGAAVQQWQQIIGVAADGKFGPNTKAVTITWQRSHGLVADGIVGPKTWSAALGAPPPAASPTVVTVFGQPVATPIPLPSLPAAPSPAPVVVATLANQLPMLKVGSTGPAVMKWQELVRVAVDGKFGPQTEAATKAFQKSRGLVADGIVGPKTWAAAMTPSAPAPAPAAPMPLPMPPVMTTPVSLPMPAVPDFTMPPLPPMAEPIGTAPMPGLPPSVTTFPVPPIFTQGGPPPFIPGQVSTVQTPDGPVVGTTDRTGREVTVTSPPITGSAPSSGPGAVGVLLVLGTLIAVGSSGRKGFL